MTFDVRDYIFEQGRLLERKLYGQVFQEEDGFKEALIAYQNPDGGFGNGIEPDILCPMSTMIGSETALYYTEISGIEKDQIVKDVLHWLERLIDTGGDLAFPTEEMLEYPHQAWWKNPDSNRIFAIYGLLKAHGVEYPGLEKELIERFNAVELPEKLSFYDYIYYIFARYVLKDDQLVKRFIDGFMVLLEEEKDHYPLFSRHWYTMLDYMDDEVIENQMAYFLDGIHGEEMRMPYPELPWWNPIMVLDGLLIIEKYQLMGEEDE